PPSEQSIDFSNCGGGRPGVTLVTDEGERIIYGPDSTGFGPNPTNMDVDVQNLFLTDDGKHALVAFLKSFTDERVRWERAPFDHPQLFVPNGMPGDEAAVHGTRADEDRIEIPAVGAPGRGPLGLPPLQGFLQ